MALNSSSPGTHASPPYFSGGVNQNEKRMPARSLCYAVSELELSAVCSQLCAGGRPPTNRGSDLAKALRSGRHRMRQTWKVQDMQCVVFPGSRLQLPLGPFTVAAPVPAAAAAGTAGAHNRQLR